MTLQDIKEAKSCGARMDGQHENSTPTTNIDGGGIKTKYAVGITKFTEKYSKLVKLNLQNYIVSYTEFTDIYSK